MAKVKAAQLSEEEFRTQAIGKVVEVLAAECELKVSGKGGLFASAKGANAAVYARCFDADQPLLAVSKVGKSEIARVTPTGFLEAAPRLEADRVGAAAKAVAAGIPATERVAFLNDVAAKVPAALADLLPLLEAAVAAEKTEREAEADRRAKHRAREAANLAALDRWKALIEAQRQARIDALREALAAEGVKGEEPPPQVAPKRREPETKADLSFRRDVANQLVSSWRETWNPDRPDVRDFLESAMWNIRGFELIGEAGAETAFDGRYHDGPAGLFTGDPIRVVRPGWLLKEGEDGEYVALKATVEKSG